MLTVAADDGAVDANCAATGVVVVDDVQADVAAVVDEGHAVVAGALSSPIHVGRSNAPAADVVVIR